MCQRYLKRAVAGRWHRFTLPSPWVPHKLKYWALVLCLLSAAEREGLCAAVSQPPTWPKALWQTVQIEGSRWGPIWHDYRPASHLRLENHNVSIKRSNHWRVTAVHDHSHVSYQDRHWHSTHIDTVNTCLARHRSDTCQNVQIIVD